jgi:hypothetical protein
MGVKDYTLLKGINSIGETLLMTELEHNLKAFLDWSLLESAGAWTDVYIPQSGVHGGVFHTLRPVFDPNFTDGQVWETIHSDWCYETGVNHGTGLLSPINISGVYVTGIYYPTGDSTYGHYYDYPLGRVIFDSPISTGLTVSMEYSFREVQIGVAGDSQIWKEIQYGSLRPDDSHWTSKDDRGEWSRMGVQRQQLPAIVLEAVPRRTQRAYELGNGSLIVNQDILCHVISQDRWYRNQLIDVLCLQDKKTIYMFNSDEVVASGVEPLDYRGMRSTQAAMYPVLTANRGQGYRWKELRFNGIECSEAITNDPNLHIGTVRMTCEVVYGEI